MRRPPLALLLALAACSVRHPPGWPEGQAPSEQVTATPWVPTGSAPLRWDLGRGGQIDIDVERRAVLSGGGAYQSEIRFAAAYRDGEGSPLVCATEPAGPGVPRTRFGCWSQGDPAALRFWLAPGVDCPARHAGTARTLTTPACWDGELEAQGRRLTLRHAHLRRVGAPIGRVAWLDEAGHALLAADIVREARFDLFDVDPPVPPELRRDLVLVTVALAWWEHAAEPS